MKKGLVFFLGMLVGALLLFGIFSFLGYFNIASVTIEDPQPKQFTMPGLTLFEEPGDVMDLRSFKVREVMSNGATHMEGIKKSKPGEFDFIAGTRVLFLPEEGVLYYDDQVILVPADKCVQIIGTYRYEETGVFGAGTYTKTIPVVKIVNK